MPPQNGADKLLDMMVSRARLKTNAETGLHGSHTSYTEYASDRNALLLRVGACVLRLV